MSGISTNRTLSSISSISGDNPDEILQSGYLNRKCVHDSGSKKSKDRQWLTLWCNVKGTMMEFFKVDGVSSKSQSGLPPKEHFPPSNLKQFKFGHISIEGATIDVDYTSQMNVELEKRKPHLFQVVLANDTAEYIFQAPSKNKRMDWVISLQTASRKNRHIDPDTSIVYSSLHSIRASRDSIKQKNRQNIHSVHKASVPVLGNTEESDYVELSAVESIMKGDPRLKLLKKHLQTKKELLKQLKTMYTSYMGGTAAMYVESLIHHEGPSPEPEASTDFTCEQLLHHDPAASTGVPHRRMSLQDTNVLSVSSEDGVDRRASTGNFNIPIIIEGMFNESIQTELLIDYYLVPGAKWSKLYKGEKVWVLGRARNGWYRCVALRNSSVSLEAISGSPLSLGELSDLSLSSDSNTAPVNSLQTSRLSITSMGVASISEEQEPPLVGVTGSEVNCDSNDSVMVSCKVDPVNMEKEKHEGNLLDTSCAESLSSSFSEKHDEMKSDESDTELAELPGVSPIAYVGRTSSYSLATLEENAPFEGILRKVNDRRGKRNIKTHPVGRSTSSVVLPPAASGLFRQSVENKRRSESYSTSGQKSTPPPWRLISIFENEMKKLKTYQVPLMGCIAPSVLKCFQEVDGLSAHGSSCSPSVVPITDQNGHVNEPEGIVFSQPSIFPQDTGFPEEILVPVTSESPSGFKESCIFPQDTGFVDYSQVTHTSESPSSFKESCIFPQDTGFVDYSQVSHTSESPSSFKESCIFPQDTGFVDYSQVSHTSASPNLKEGCIFPQDTGFLENSQVSGTSTNPCDFKECSLTESPDSEANSTAVVSTTLSDSEGVDDSTLITDPGDIDLIDSEDGEQEDALKESMDRRSRARSLPPPTICHSPTASSPVHSRGLEVVDKPTKSSSSSATLKATVSPTLKEQAGKHSESGSSLTGRPSFLKKLFTRKKVVPKSFTGSIQDHTHSSLGSSNEQEIPHGQKNHRPHSAPHKKNPALRSVIAQLRDESAPQDRSRVSSVSGRPVRCEGVGVVIGDSSSESDEDNDDPDDDVTISPSSSYQEESIIEDVSSPISKAIPCDTDIPVTVTQDYSDSATTSFPRMRRSASEHDSLSLKAALQDEKTVNREELHPKSSSSLTRALIYKIPTFKKTKTEEATSPKAKGKTMKVKAKKRGSSVSDSYKLDTMSPGTPETNTKWDVIFRAPPRGQKRFVYLDCQDGINSKYGFRLQSYGRIRERGKVLQTFVQSVVPGSVSFLAGLYPGDAIIEVNGDDVKYAPVDMVVKAIQKGAMTMERITLMVEFVEGVTRLELMKKADDVKMEIKARQARLRKILETNPSSLILSPSPQPIILADELAPWCDATSSSKSSYPLYLYDKHINSVISLHKEAITGLDCDALVIPLSSCNMVTHVNENDSVVMHLLHAGGEDLMDELSLAKQCRLGENIVTKGHNLHTKNLFHCAFGTLEESLQKCCCNALNEASVENYKTVTFWLDGFASISVTPQIIIESVRQWLQEDNNCKVFDRVVFSAKANLALIESVMENTFPLKYIAIRDSTISDQWSEVSGSLNFEQSVDIPTSPLTAEPENKHVEEISFEPASKEESVSLEDEEDQLSDLPDRGQKARPPLIGRVSISDIGIQLTEEESSDPQLLMDDLESDHSDGQESPPLFSLLGGVQENKGMNVYGSTSLSDECNHSTPPTVFTFSKSLPDGDQSAMHSERKVQRSISPSILAKRISCTLTLNPGRQESDV